MNYIESSFKIKVLELYRNMFIAGLQSSFYSAYGSMSRNFQRK